MSKNKQSAIKATYISLAGNTVLAIVKGLTGFFGNSYALIADAIESTTDIFSSLMVLLGIRYATPAPSHSAGGLGAGSNYFPEIF